MAFCRRIDTIQNFGHPLSGQSTDVDAFCPTKEIETRSQILIVVVNRRGIFVDRIPFIHHNHTGSTFVLNPTCQLLILIGHSIDCIDHEKYHIRPSNRFEGTIDTEKFRPVLHIFLASNPCRIYQAIALISTFYNHVNGITGGS